MKLKIVKNSTEINVLDGTKLDYKRDGGFWTTQVDFYSTTKNLFNRFDRIELFDYANLSYPLDIRILGAYRTFTNNTHSFTSGGVTITIIIELKIKTVKFKVINGSYLDDDVVIIEPTSGIVTNIRKGGKMLWEGSQRVYAGDSILTSGVEADKTYWLVAKTPRTKINYETTPTYLHNLILIEPNKILQGQFVSDIAFTQALNGTLTLADLMVLILRKSKTRLWGSRASTEFTLSSAGANKLTRIAPDMIFEKMNLFEILVKIGKVIDAFPKIVNWTEIDFEYINVSTTSLTPNIIQIEYNDDTDDFATELLMDAANVDTGEISAYPNKNLATFVIPSDLYTTTTADNAIVELPFKIKRIEKIILQRFIAADEDYPDLIPSIAQEIEFTEGNGYVEKSAWELLKQQPFATKAWEFLEGLGLPFTDLKSTTAYFQYGDNKIYNIQALKNYSGTTEAITKLGVIVYYEPYLDIQIAKSNGIVLDGGLTFTEYITQDAPTLDRISTQRRLKNEIKNKKSSIATVTYHSITAPNLRTRMSLDGVTYICTRMVVTKYTNYYEVVAECSTDFNKESQFIAVDKMPRKYELDFKETVNRIIRWNKKFYVTCSAPASTAGGTSLVLTNFTKSGTLAFLYPLAKEFSDDFIKGDIMALCRFIHTDTSIVVALPTVYARDEDRISIIFKTRDNINSDFLKRFESINWELIAETKEAISAVYTDELGEVLSVDVKLVPMNFDEQIQEIEGSLITHQVQEFLRYTYPFAIDSYFEDGFNVGVGKTWELLTMEGDLGFYLAKDKREGLTFQLDYDIEGSNCVVYEDFFKHTAFFKKIGTGTNVTMTMIAQGVSEEIACTYTSCLVEDNKIVITFTPVVGGSSRTITDVLFRVGGELIFSKTYTAGAVTVTQQEYKITIAIGE